MKRRTIALVFAPIAVAAIAVVGMRPNAYRKIQDVTETDGERWRTAVLLERERPKRLDRVLGLRVSSDFCEWLRKARNPPQGRAVTSA